MERVIGLLDAIPYIRAYSGQTFVVKAGGELLDDARWRDGIARDLAVLHRLGIQVVLVHGGGPQLDAAAAKAGLETKTVAGRRVTSLALVDAAVAEWRGRLSMKWVTALQAHNERAIGLSGVDAGLIRAEKRPPAKVKDDSGETLTVDYGMVGDVREIRVDVLKAAMAVAIPVVTPLAKGANGEILNVNADTVAAEIAVAIGAAKLVLLTRAPGILANPEDPASVLHWTDLVELAELEEKGMIRGGMRPKVAAVRRALQGGVPRVHIVDGRRPGSLLSEVFTTEGSGTLVVLEADDTPAEPLAP
jgi:acetylglutamate kinase